MPLLDLSEGAESSKPFLELRREMLVFAPPPTIILSLLPAPVCAARAVLVEWQPRFPVVRALS